MPEPKKAEAVAETKKKGGDVALVVRPGRTVVIGEAATTKNDRGETVAAAPTEKKYGPGDEFTVDAAEAKRMIKDGAAVRADAPEARAIRRLSDMIPGNFPHADALLENGIETFSALSTAGELTELEGVDAKKADAINEAVAKRAAERAEPKK